jgi:hypothetical protein
MYLICKPLASKIICVQKWKVEITLLTPATLMTRHGILLSVHERCGGRFCTNRLSVHELCGGRFCTNYLSVHELCGGQFCTNYLSVHELCGGWFCTNCLSVLNCVGVNSVQTACQFMNCVRVDSVQIICQLWTVQGSVLYKLSVSSELCGGRFCTNCLSVHELCGGRFSTNYLSVMNCVGSVLYKLSFRSPHKKITTVVYRSGEYGGLEHLQPQH